MTSLENELDQLGTSRWSLADFDIGKPLGKGHFGKVYLARLKQDNFLVVLKCVTKELLVNEGGEHQIKREIEIMQNTRHPNVLRMFGWFHDAKRVFMILEYADGGEIYKHLRKAGRFSERRSSRYIGQIAEGLLYLHGKNVLHRDIKPENLLLGAGDVVKICDFGWSVHTAGKQQTLAGTLSYVPPEMIMGQAYDHTIDIWALGVLAYEFVCGMEPFAGDDARHTQSRICRVDLTFPPFVSDAARNFMMQVCHPRTR